MFTFAINSAFTFGLRALQQNQDDVASSLEKLATGKKINRASDDPSGIIAIEDHKAQIYSLNKRLDAFAQQEGFLGAKEGGLSVINDSLIELNGLIVQSANTASTTPEEQAGIKQQIKSILGGIDTIARNTTYKGLTVLSEYTTGNIDNGLSGLAELIDTDPEKAQQIAQDAVDSIAITRGAIGNQLNDIDSQRKVIGEELTNLTGSLSSIQDTDYAAEAAKLVRSQIKQQASIAAIDISRQSAQQVLGLLQGAAQFSKTI